MQSIAMLVGELNRVTTVLESAAEDLLLHADATRDVNIPVEAFGAGEATWQVYDQRRQALEADLRGAHGHVANSGSLLRTAVDAHVSNEASSSTNIASILRA